MKDNFKLLAKETSAILKRDFDISLNFKGYDELISNYEIIEMIDLYSLNELIKDSNQWASYLSELRNFLLYYEDLYKAKVDIYDYLLFIHKQDMRQTLNPQDKLLNNNLKRKYKIVKSSDNDILEELNYKIKEARKDFNLIKKFNNVLLSRSRLFEKIFFVSVREYSKNLFDLHFK